MTTFDDRDKGFENKFAHDEELAFKITALCNKMAALWAAGLMGKTGKAAEDYARSIVEYEVSDDAHKGLEAKLIDDLQKAGVEVTHKELHKEIARIMPIARNKLMGSTN